MATDNVLLNIIKEKYQLASTDNIPPNIIEYERSLLDNLIVIFLHHTNFQKQQSKSMLQ